MIGRTFRGLIQVLAGLGAGLAIVLVLFAWRLSSGPISLAFLSPYIENVLSSSHKSFNFRLDDTILTWAGWQRALDIRAINVRILGPDKKQIASIPELSFSLSARALVRGVLAPKTIDLFRPKLRLVRQTDGRFEVAFGGGEEPSAELFRRLLRQLSAAPDPDKAMSYLSYVNMVDADLTIVDRRLGTSWKAPSAQARLRRDAVGMRGDASFDLEVGGKKTRVTVLGTYAAVAEKLDLAVTFSPISPALFSGLAPGLEPLAIFDLPLGGNVTLGMTAAGTVESVGFDLRGEDGFIALPDPLAQRLPVRTVALKGRFDGASDRLRLDEFYVDLGEKGEVFLPAPTNHKMPVRSITGRGVYDMAAKRLTIESMTADLHGPTVSLTASVDGIGGELVATAEGTLNDLPVKALARYWPRAWGKNAHDWIVANLSQGLLNKARAKITVKGRPDGGFDLISIGGDMVMTDLAVNYLSPMPKATKIAATAKFDRKSFDIALTHGRLGRLSAYEGRVLFTGLDQYDQYADISLLIVGPFEDAMALIDHQPLGFASAVGIRPDKTGGYAATRLKLKFIVEHALTLDRVKVSATSELTGVSIEDAIFGQKLKEGHLLLDVDKAGMDVRGKVTLAGFPASLSWRKNFGDKADYQSRYEISGRIDDIQRLRDLGLDTGPFTDEVVRGGVDGTMIYKLYGDKSGHVKLDLDLAGLEVNLPPLGWTKEKGVPGSAAVDLNLTGDSVRAIPSFSIVAAGLSARGSARFREDGGGLERVDLKRMTYGRTDMSGVAMPGRDGGWTMSFYGPSFNLEPILEDMRRADPAAEEAVPAEGETGLNLSLSADLDRVWLSQDRYMSRVTGSMARAGERWRTINLDGLIGGKRFSLKLAPGKKGSRTLVIDADDAGATLKAFDIYDNMVGGTMRVTGTFDESLPDRPLKGHLSIEDYRIVDAPALAQVLSIMSLTGIVEALQGDGLAFSRLDAPFNLSDGVLDVSDAKVTGISLGFTASGKVYTHAEVVRIHGTVVPAYAINSALGLVPFLGPIFTGTEEGGGVFAASYRLTGPIENPKVSVNPLTALAPGILRKLFGFFGFDNSTSTPEPPESEEPFRVGD